tara:strand:- start:4204 stop:4944 length:741 start_codon:yes stop_codon:yes gene_type:complete
MDYLSSYTPGSSELPHSVNDGIQPYSRINEIVQNAFIDPFEWNNLEDSVSKEETLCTDRYQLEILREGNAGQKNCVLNPGDNKPLFHKWATALPGMIAVTRKCKDMNYGGYTAAETAIPVVVCAQGMMKALDDEFFCAGIVRSKSVKTEDDGCGPGSDSHFTVHVGGICTILNNAPEVLNPGDGIAWSFENFSPFVSPNRKPTHEPRRIQVVRVPPGNSHPRMFARVLNYARPGEGCDILVGPSSC